MSQKKKIVMPQINPMKENQDYLQKLNTIKQKYNAGKGQADGMMADSFGQAMQDCANLLGQVLQEKQSLQMRITQLEAELQKPANKIPKNMTDLPDVEKAEPEPKK